MTGAIVKIDAKKFGLSETQAKKVENAFKPMLDKMVRLEDEYNRIVALPITSDVCHEAHTLRLEYVRVRTGTAAIHKAQKAWYRAGGLFVDGWKNAQLFASQGIEDKLNKIEFHFERLADERAKKRQEERAESLMEFDPGYIPEDLGTMNSEVWKNYYSGVRLNYENRKESERKAEEERIRMEKEAEEEQLRIRIENERLKEEAEERERVAASEKKKRDKAEAKRRAEEEKKRKELELKYKKEREDREKKYAARRAEEEKKRKAIEAKLYIEKRERERLEAEESARQKAEQAAIKDEEKARKKAEAAPDINKLAALARDITSIQIPAFASDEARSIADKTSFRLNEIAEWVKSRTKEME